MVPERPLVRLGSLAARTRRQWRHWRQCVRARVSAHVSRASSGFLSWHRRLVSCV